MTDLLKQKNALGEYERSRLGAAPVVGGAPQIVAQTTPGAEEFLKLRESLLGAAATATEREFGNRTAAADADHEIEMLERAEKLEILREGAVAREDERRERTAAHNQGGPMAFMDRVLAMQEAASTRQDAKLDALMDGREASAQTQAITEMREATTSMLGELTAALARPSGADSVVAELERLTELQDKARSLFGGNVPAEVGGDLDLLKLQHENHVATRELEHRLSMEDREMELREQQWIQEQGASDRRSDQLGSAIDMMKPIFEDAVNNWAEKQEAEVVSAVPGAVNGRAQTYAAPVVMPPAAAPPAAVNGNGNGAIAATVPITSGACPQCGASILMAEEQSIAVCQACANVVHVVPEEPAATPDEPASAPPPPAEGLLSVEELLGDDFSGLL